MKTSVPPQNPYQAFSLVELLVVISVIAIIAALAIPQMINLTNQSIFQKDRRNAQTIASMAASAKGAGATNDLSGTNVVDILQPPGITVTRGATVLSFSVSAMSSEERTGAVAYLTPATNTTMAVQYTPE
jgi:type IV pilus assembly protein PilA